MKALRTYALGFALLSLFPGCSSAPHLRPPNEINRPVFYSGRYTDFGLTAGMLDVELEDRETRPWSEVYASPRWNHFVPVNDWSGYNVIPTLWSFLITGSQFSDSLHLQSGKLHLAAHAGLSGFYYSQRDGWRFPFTAMVSGKYLFSDRLFSDGDFGFQFDDLDFAGGRALQSLLRFGWQWNGSASLSLGYGNTKYFPDPNHYFASYSIPFREGDERNEFLFRLDGYVHRRHVFSPEFGIGYRNLEFGGTRYLKAGLGYYFMFK